MNLRKAGTIGVGALATMFAMSPMASAAELPTVPSLPELPSTSATAPEGCTFTGSGEDGSEISSISEDGPANAIAQAPLGGDVGPTFGECSTYGQDNDQGNGQDNAYSVNGVSQPFPSFPGGLGSSPGSGFGGGVL